MTVNKDFFELQKLFFVEKKYDETIQYIVSSRFVELADFQEILANAYFMKFDFVSAATIYQRLGMLYHVGYCHLLFGDTKTARSVWDNTPVSSAQKWGMFFCELFGEKVVTVPTFLQIRAFLERDLALFLKLNHVVFVQKIIDVSEFLFDINQETNKIIARTFLYNNYPTYAKEFFNRALDFTTQDAELYYLLGLYYKGQNDLKEAKNAFRSAVFLNNNYLMAKIQYEDLKDI